MRQEFRLKMATKSANTKVVEFATAIAFRKSGRLARQQVGNVPQLGRRHPRFLLILQRIATFGVVSQRGYRIDQSNQIAA
jgi:hypothetical protein